jgi:hypothetical protein
MRESLTILDLSDREFLLIVDEVADADGWADSLAIAQALELEHRHSASSRLSWLSRTAELCEREHRRDEHGNLRWHKSGKPMHTQRWKLTELGRAYAYGRLKARQREALDRIDDMALLEVTNLITERARRDPAAKWLMNRQWRYGLAQNGNTPHR